MTLPRAYKSRKVWPDPFHCCGVARGHRRRSLHAHSVKRAGVDACLHFEARLFATRVHDPSRRRKKRCGMAWGLSVVAGHGQVGPNLYVAVTYSARIPSRETHPDLVGADTAQVKSEAWPFLCLALGLSGRVALKEGTGYRIRSGRGRTTLSLTGFARYLARESPAQRLVGVS